MCTMYMVSARHGHRSEANLQAVIRVSIVSSGFEGLKPIQRHRKVYEILAEELQAGVHALALNTKTPAEVPSGLSH